MGHRRCFHNQFPPFFSVLHCPLELGELQACPFPNMSSSYLFFCQLCLLLPFTVPCKMVLARPDGRETCPYHCSLRLFMMVRRSSCGLTACWNLVWTSSLVTWSSWLVFFFACSSAVRAHDSQSFSALSFYQDNLNSFNIMCFPSKVVMEGSESEHCSHLSPCDDDANGAALVKLCRNFTVLAAAWVT